MTNGKDDFDKFFGHEPAATSGRLPANPVKKPQPSIQEQAAKMVAESYSIDSAGFVKLHEIKSRIFCTKCGELLALVNGAVVLILSALTLIDGGVTNARCRRCGHINEVLRREKAGGRVV